MKKIYMALFLLLLTFFKNIDAQVIIINDNHSLNGFPIFGNSIFFISDLDSTLWTSDGTPAGTQQYAFNVKMDPDGGAGILNNKIYFAGIDATHGSELWVTDGTAAGTNLVQDFVSGTESSTPDDFFLFGNNLYFTDSSSSGRELYKISGSNGAISLFKEINPGPGNGFGRNGSNFFSYNNLMYFSADDGTNGQELWVSDGTAANTKMLKDITPGSDGTNFNEFTHLGNWVIFSVSTPEYSLDLWKTDGTNTTLIKSFNVPFSSFSAFGLLTFNNKIYFGGTDAVNGAELWSTDGNTAAMVKDIFPGSQDGIPNSSTPLLFNAVFINNRFLFSASDANGIELWSSDGTAANTTMIKDINPVGSADPVLFPVINYDQVLEGSGFFDFFQRNILLNGYIYFSADDGTNGTQLWKTNGTAQGTVLVKNIGGAAGGVSGSYFYTKTGLYFSANDVTHGMEPWFTDGTNTQIVDDINPGSGSSDPGFTFVFNNNLFGTADNGNSANNYTDVFRINTTVSALPVRFVSFKASLQTDGVRLYWTTATEINSSNFVIQRSIDGIHFFNIGSVAASGNSTVEESYFFNDEKYLDAASDILFYRLQLNDKDGKINYSQVRTVRLNTSSLIIRTYPNPVHNQLTVVFGKTSSKTFLVKITDVNGKQVYLQKTATANSHLQNIDVSGFAKGTYFIQVILGKETHISKFVKQ